MESRNTSSNAPDEQHAPTSIVCLYATRDESMYRELQTHLILWHTKGHIRWLELSAGADVEQTLLAFVQQADCVLLLISSSFFATSLYHRMMESALAEQTKRGVPVVPILARACDWKESACGGLKALPDNELPIAEWEHQERAYENIRAGLVRLIPSLATHMASLAIRPKHFQARDLPKGYVPRPKAFDEIKHLLLNHQGNRTTAITTALRGAGGFGKTTLALALCHDPEIQATFPDGILWVELGEQPPRPLDVLNGVLASLDTSLSGAITLEEARDRWRTALQGRVCLLVIDDVWQIGALEQLLEGGPQCVRLVTTRNDQVLPEEAVRVLVDEMEPTEAIALLRRGLPDEIQQAAYQPRLKELAKRLGYWPLLLTLAHGMLTSFVKRGQTIEKALTNIGKAYQTRGVTAFHQENADERQQTADACLDISLRHLKKVTPPHYDAITRYHELAVFPEDTDIPLTTLQTYWQGTGDLEDWEMEDLCVYLDDLSLILPTDFGKGTIRLHDVFRSYLLQHAGVHLPALHARLLDAYQQEHGLTRWADLPRSEGYLWQHLILHLCQAGHLDALQATLSDLSYLAHKALYEGVSALETDLILASMLPPTDTAGLATPFFTSLHRSIVRISHLLRQAQTLAEMGGLLLSYFGWEAAFAAQRFPLERELPRPFLLAWNPLSSRSSLALQRTFWKHTERVNGCAVSPDGNWIVSASQDKTLKIWDAITGAERLTLSGHTDGVQSCAVSPNGRFIVSASWDKTLKVWNATTGDEHQTLSSHAHGVSGCAISPDGSFIVSASHDRTLKVWDVATGSERLTLSGHTGSIFGCAVSPDGSFIVSASWDSTLKVWDVITGTERLTLSSHTAQVLDCAVSPDGSFIVSASSDATLKVWDTAICTEQMILSGHTERVHDCAVSPDGSFIVSASSDKTLKVWDTITGTERLTLSGHTDGIFGCAISPDGSFIVSASSDKTLKVWDTITGTERLTLSGHADRIWGCAVSPDGSFIVSASHDKTLKVWDAVTGIERLTLSGHTGGIFDCAVSPNGRFIVSASWDSTLKVWDTITGTERLTLPGHTDKVQGCRVSPDENWIVSASWDQTLKMWNAVTGVERFTLSGHTNHVSCCTVSPDGHFIVSASADHTLKVWDAQTGRCALTFPIDGGLSGSVFHSDGLHLVAYGEHGLFFLRLVV